MTESVAITIVTYNRCEMLERQLRGLAELSPAPDAVIVIDNASSDETAEVLARSDLPGLQVITSTENLGGAGGFRLGVLTAYRQGFDRIWLMDDDVIPAPDCLGVLLAADEDCLMAVRENLDGSLIELSATRFDLRSPFAIRPKRESVLSRYGSRARMPERVALENVAFEGFMIRRDVVCEIGLPDDSFFIFYDDVDYALRARAAGHRIWALRDARLIRQLDFSQQHDLAGWKGFYMYRNLFAVHRRWGENALVRAKPLPIALGVVLVSLLRRRPGEARNALRALRASRAMAARPSTHIPA